METEKGIFSFMDKYILGLNIANHDSAAALIKNGEIVKFVEQERVSRNKLALGEAPVDAILECLKSERITIKDIEAVSVGMDWKYRNKLYQMTAEEKAKYEIFEDPNFYLPENVFGNQLPPIHIVKHHLAHAASACRVSDFKECAVLVIDNRGEDASTSLGIYKGGKINFFRQVNIQNSLGIFYNRAARFTGLYGKYREVGKFMGLASYGVPSMKMPLSYSEDKNLFKELPNLDKNGIFDSIEERTSQFKQYFEENCFPYESGNSDEIMSYANFAASVQKALEDTLIGFVKELKEVTRMDNLVISGGIALNCSANGKIVKTGIFKNVFVPPFPSDAGTAVGAALEIYHKLFGKAHTESKLVMAGLGTSYSQETVISELKPYVDSNSISYSIKDERELYDFVAKAIADGNIIGWMQDGFEAGPRALGYRSLLADPRTRRSLIRLNKVKQREMWRPIAPSVLSEKYSEYFEGNADSRYFMNVAAIVLENKRKEIPAVVHVDTTARPQAVTCKQQKYYNLLSAFYRLTGVPVLCNTSFNRKGEPLVNTPKDAIECFLNCEIDMLVIGNIVIRRNAC